jgi:hypothetical protein
MNLSMSPRYDEVTMERTFPVILPEEVLNKIKYLCKSIPREEWSGILFYTVENSITDKNFTITLQDILPMDKGTAAFTSFNLDKRFVDFLMDNPHAMAWKVGLIHSHNVMEVFFSGTDISELHDNAAAHNFYLSLIVNNYMDMTAKVAIYAKAETASTSIPYVALNEEGEPYTVFEEPLSIKKEKLIIHNCKIYTKQQEIKVEESFAEAVRGILAPKKYAYTPPANTNKYSKTDKNDKKPLFKDEDWEDADWFPNKTFPKKDDKKVPNKFLTAKLLEEIRKEGLLPDSIYENIFLKLIGEKEVQEVELYAMLEEFEDKVNFLTESWLDLEMTPEQIAKNILVYISEGYTELFPFSGEKVTDIVRNVDRVINIIQTLFTYRSYYNPTISLLNEMIRNLKEMEGNKEPEILTKNEPVKI